MIHNHLDKMQIIWNVHHFCKIMPFVQRSISGESQKKSERVWKTVALLWSRNGDLAKSSFLPSALFRVSLTQKILTKKKKKNDANSSKRNLLDNEAIFHIQIRNKTGREQEKKKFFRLLFTKATTTLWRWSKRPSFFYHTPKGASSRKEAR